MCATLNLPHCPITRQNTTFTQSCWCQRGPWNMCVLQRVGTQWQSSSANQIYCECHPFPFRPPCHLMSLSHQSLLLSASALSLSPESVPLCSFICHLLPSIHLSILTSVSTVPFLFLLSVCLLVPLHSSRALMPDYYCSVMSSLQHQNYLQWQSCCVWASSAKTNGGAAHESWNAHYRKICTARGIRLSDKRDSKAIRHCRSM